MGISDQLLQKVLVVILFLAILFEPGQRSTENPLNYDVRALFHFEYDMKASLSSFC